MGGGGGDFLKVLKATNPITKPGEHTAMVLDPGGLVNVSKDKDVAALQAKLDIGGYGAKAALEEQAQSLLDSKQAAQEAEIARQSTEASAAVESRRKRMSWARASGRSSLLSGSELGVQGTQSKLG